MCHQSSGDTHASILCLSQQQRGSHSGPHGAGCCLQVAAAQRRWQVEHDAWADSHRQRMEAWLAIKSQLAATQEPGTAGVASSLLHQQHDELGCHSSTSSSQHQGQQHQQQAHMHSRQQVGSTAIEAAAGSGSGTRSTARHGDAAARARDVGNTGKHADQTSVHKHQGPTFSSLHAAVAAAEATGAEAGSAGQRTSAGSASSTGSQHASSGAAGHPLIPLLERGLARPGSTAGSSGAHGAPRVSGAFTITSAPPAAAVPAANARPASASPQQAPGKPADMASAAAHVAALNR
jgi:hypothetical protein